MTRRWSLRLVVGLLTGVAVLSGCSDERPANDSLPTSSATPTEEELPPLGPEDLPMPAEARTQDAAGAEAFVRYYIALINRTSDVMDAEPLREFSEKSCEECDRIATNTEEDAAAGYDYEGGELTVTEVAAPLVNGLRAELALRVDQAPLNVLDPSGAAIDHLGSDAFVGLASSAALSWDSEHAAWVMTGLTLG